MKNSKLEVCISCVAVVGTTMFSNVAQATSALCEPIAAAAPRGHVEILDVQTVNAVRPEPGLAALLAALAADRSQLAMGLAAEALARLQQDARVPELPRLAEAYVPVKAALVGAAKSAGARPATVELDARGP